MMAEGAGGAGDGAGERPGKRKRGRDEWTPRKDGWTGEKRRIFLDTLAATLNARHSARKAGMSYGAAAGLRRREPEFAEQWLHAVRSGYSTLETMLMLNSFRKGAPEPDGDEDEPPDPAGMDTALALELLKLRQRELNGGAHRGGPVPKRASEAETDAAILKKLTALRRRLGLPPDEDEW